MTELAHQGISFTRDPSNKKTVYQRNRIRHHLMPILQTYNPKIRATLCREAALLRDENDFISQSLSATLPSLDIKFDDVSVVFNIEKMTPLHPALQRRVLRFGIERLLEYRRESSFETIEAIRRQMILGQKKTKLSLAQSLVAERTGLTLRITKTKHSHGKPSWPKINEEVLHKINASTSDSITDLPDWGIRLKVFLDRKREGATLPHSLSTCIASFDFDNISFPLLIRSWQPGDRFVPLGMQGHHKKLQDFFVDHKIERSERHRIPLLCCPEGILWVLGLRIDERFCVKKETSRRLTVEFQTIHATP